jgi:hypothetical protein
MKTEIKLTEKETYHGYTLYNYLVDDCYAMVVVHDPDQDRWAVVTEMKDATCWRRVFESRYWYKGATLQDGCQRGWNLRQVINNASGWCSKSTAYRRLKRD